MSSWFDFVRATHERVPQLNSESDVLVVRAESLLEAGHC
jgi:hypothetical protein